MTVPCKRCDAVSVNKGVRSSIDRTEKKTPAASSHQYSSAQRCRALMWAATENDTMRAMQLVLSMVDINGADYDGRTALHVAASCGSFEMVKYVVR